MEVPPLCPAERLKAVAQLLQTARCSRRILFQRHDHADAPHSLALLCTHRKGPRRRAAKQRDERAAVAHSITSSAMASSDGGTMRPNMRAVVLLMTNSNLVDCSTGKSAGFAPLSTRPAWIPH
jgi:hypothetical protein